MSRQPGYVSPAAIGLIVASAACFTAIDAIVKYLALRYSGRSCVLVCCTLLISSFMLFAARF